MKPDPVTRLALGGAQLGLAYGICGAREPSYDRALGVLETALCAGIDMVDTAYLYGTSHRFIGEALARLGTSMKVVTKLPALSPREMEKALRASVEDLKTSGVYGLMLHHGEALLGPQGGSMAAFLAAQRDSGVALKVGFSCYSPEEALDASRIMSPQVIQFPLNPLDQRFLISGGIKRLKDIGTEIHVRSCFLQGLLLMDPQEGSEKVKGAAPFLTRLAERALELNMSPMELALGFCLSIPEVDRVIVGVDSPKQLLEVVSAARSACGRVCAEDLKDLICFEDHVIDPRKWG
ncbi:putative oxidoreductase, aryl-alcohol dehydrogenase like protein [Thermanaerovibrio velox DSM 12556]|uniref:Putative oxidoreductase, aryl-alcohol dehydrogenase like protein n=1 Tax=Thermanaerovibrio velox DSM 12556 TaxID=926567 RepID=H0USG0_9BACT|nr:aldo/keto reductase [Thermanaerovibrio velox]EHM10249.1 putative oxidoreductase, aryl-alcohol dehydrogenase like protein [Thermanaerovibrio velox DSM 12556]